MMIFEISTLPLVLEKLIFFWRSFIETFIWGFLYNGPPDEHHGILKNYTKIFSIFSVLEFSTVVRSFDTYLSTLATSGIKYDIFQFSKLFRTWKDNVWVPSSAQLVIVSYGHLTWQNSSKFHILAPFVAPGQMS